jgi:hypothetical protein
MTVRTRRTAYARTLRSLAWGLSALLASCGGSSTAPPGTPVVTLYSTSSSGDFASYRVAIDSISLTDTNGNIVSPLITAESVDLATPTDLSELIEVPALPSATYKSASFVLDYTSASIWVNLNGQAVAASPVDTTGAAMTSSSITITFDPAHPYVVTQGQSSRLAISVDLAASNAINTSTATPTVTVLPFVVMTPAPEDATLMRARGLLVTTQSGSSDFIMNMRPFLDLVSALGAVTVTIDANTYFSINGATFTGAAGLAALGQLQENTLIGAYGTLGDLSGITPSFHATQVYVGSSFENPVAESVTGVVSARSGDALTVHGVTYVTPISSATIPNSEAVEYANNVAVTVGSSTLVSEDGVAASALTPASISVGQQVTLFGQGTIDSSGNISVDATAGLVRLAPSRVWGTVTSATSNRATLDVLSLGGFAPAAFNFTGTGTPIASAAAYVVNTGVLNESSAVSTLLQVDGIASPFGAAPPDLTASAITAGSATEQQLVIEWSTGVSAPFSSVTANGLTVNLAGTGLSSVHEIRTGPAALDLKSLAASPLITTVGAANQSNLQLAIGAASLTTGVSVFNSLSAFIGAVQSSFGSHTIFRLVAVGQYNSATNTFVASRISVSLYT